jgi:hypothetical protein
MLMLIGKKRDAEQFHRIVGVALNHLAPGLIDRKPNLVMADGFAVESYLKIEPVGETGQGSQRKENEKRARHKATHF